ncbi:MAG: DUF4298 domain-containing protein [Butyrivibrio sp.]|nr:DUF4298 domain-containing protein [Butyrivibrio sp.]
MINDVIKEVMQYKGYTQASLAQKLGYSHASGVSTKLQRANGLRVDTLIKFLDAMDCQLVIKASDKEWTISDNDSDLNEKERIKKMEELYNAASLSLTEMEKKLAEFNAIQDEIRKLGEYCDSDEWKKDYELVSQKSLMEQPTHDSLSQESISELIKRNEELLSQLKKF